MKETPDILKAKAEATISTPESVRSEDGEKLVSDKRGGISMDQANKEAAARDAFELSSINTLKDKLNDQMGTSDQSSATPESVTTSLELVANTPQEFRQFPEVAPFVNKLQSVINLSSEDPKWMRNLNIKRGASESAMQVALDGVKKISGNKGKMEIYRNVVIQGGPELAWEYIKRTGKGENYLNVNAGKLVEKGVYGNESGISGNDRT